MKKRLFILATLFIMSVAMFAQVEVTRFLGIPIDGFKKDMIQKLKNKGFEYDAANDIFNGEFNGEDVQVFIQTKNNKVWRLGIMDQNARDENQIRIRYNKLCNQFLDNSKYIYLGKESPLLSEDEDIRYNILVNNKQYQTIFYQGMVVQKDSITFNAEINDLAIKKLKEDYNMTVDSIQKLPIDKATQIQNELTQQILNSFFKEAENRIVWFTIDSNLDGYRIALFYENSYNDAHGEDL